MRVMKKVPLSLQIICAMALGMATGAWLGPKAAPLGEIGKLLIQFIKMIATPLLSVTIIHSISTSNVKVRHAGRMVGVALMNSSFALIIALALMNFLHPGEMLKEHLREKISNATVPFDGQKIDFLKTFISYFPSNWFQPFIDNSIITVVILSLFLGAGVRASKNELHPTETAHSFILDSMLEALHKVFERILYYIVKLSPLAVFGVVAKTVGEYGFSPLRGLAFYVLVCLAGLSLQIVFVYQGWLLTWIKIPLKKFWNTVQEAVFFSLGSNSSLATLPITLKTLSRLGCSKESATLGACVGTNLNNDGILLYEAMAALFIAQAHGINLSLGGQIQMSLVSVVAAMGVAGVPEAGFVSLALVLSTVGLPTEMLPLLLTVDWILARARSAVNVLSDISLSLILDRFEK